ncbi:MAG: NAD regulator [Hyphomonadaceae bacterium]|nr:NAD regulator [Hyphomonadaceae bacterium]
MSAQLVIGLSAVIVAADPEQPCVLVTRRDGDESALPFGPFDPLGHRTFELGLRGWVCEQTGFDLGYVEQLYTFGDRGRETPGARLADAANTSRVISVGYLALTPDQAEIDTSFDARWRSWYSFFPWEDHRRGRPEMIDSEIAPRLTSWAAGNIGRLDRARVAFGLGEDNLWVEERVLERYELLYEAGLVPECARDAGLEAGEEGFGQSMASDHRRILATAMGRLRGKVKYRPVVFELMPDRFTLSSLQKVMESLLGRMLHTQNFRRALDKADLVEGTGAMETSTGGRPAELYRFKREFVRRKELSGLSTPAVRRDA